MKVWDQKPAKHVLGSRESVDEHGDPAMLEANRVANRQDVGLLWENGDDGLNGVTGRVDLQPSKNQSQPERSGEPRFVSKSRTRSQKAKVGHPRA